MHDRRRDRGVFGETGSGHVQITWTGSNSRRKVTEIYKGALFQASRPVTVVETAAGLAMTVNAVNLAVHRLRKRYRALLEQEVAATLDDPAEVADEIKSLFDALTRSPGRRCKVSRCRAYD